jgi:hypothetical protein
MRHTLARALSIVGHPLCVVPLTSLVAIASHGLGWRAVWVTAIFFVSLSLIVLAFAWRQVRAGRWQDIRRKQRDRAALVELLPRYRSFHRRLHQLSPVAASRPHARALDVGEPRGSGDAFIALGQVSLHVGFLVYSTAILWYSGVWFVAIGLCLATAVAWSRLELRRHALVEVVLGSVVGGIAGLLFWVLLLHLLR